MEKIKSQSENPSGLHARYYIQKLVENERWGQKREAQYHTVPVDEDAEYFVLRLDEGGSDPKHIAAGRIGIHAYADAIQPHLPDLAKDLKERYPLL